MKKVELVSEILEIAQSLDRGDITFDKATEQAEALVNDDRTEQLNLYGVSNQRGLLIDAFNWYRQTSLNVDSYPSEDLADEYVKGNL